METKRFKIADSLMKSEVDAEDVDMLLNSPDCEQIDPEEEAEVNLIIKQEIEDDLEYKCRCCKFVAVSFDELVKHENGHRARGSFLECEYCDFCTNTREVMIQHVTKHTGERPYKCKHCEFSSRWKRDLIKHQVKHSDEKNFMCSQCDFKTKWYNNIRHHQITHSSERPFLCHICDMKFKRKASLDYHLYRHNDYKPKKCTKCYFRCKTNFELKLHQHKHSDVRNFPCTFPGCTQKCKTKSDLTKHNKIHSNVRDKICDICMKGFSTFANLSKHKMRHVAVRKFQCDLCASKFKTRVSLRNHLQTHNDHKPFSCDVCGHQCRNKHNLNQHKLTHSDDREHICPICPYAAKFPFHIFAHIGTFHSDQYCYFCEKCRKPFRRYSQLQTHCSRMHKDVDLLSAKPMIKEEPITDTEMTTTHNSTSVDYDKNHSVKTEMTNDLKESVCTQILSPDSETTDNSVLKESTSNVIICNIGPFRLPLASKGFDFNFEKTGKKPKKWFMDPQNMTDENAANKQRAYIEKKDRRKDKSRGATLRKFGWQKPPYKPSLEDNPRHKQERERLKQEKEEGKTFVKQDPDLMDLINVGKTNIKSVKICKKAGQLMKNWKILEVKLEKLDGVDLHYSPSTSDQAEPSSNTENPTQVPNTTDVGNSINTSSTVHSDGSQPLKGKLKGPYKSTAKPMISESELIATNKLTIKVPRTEKHKKKRGRPCKHPKKKKRIILNSMKIKSANDLLTYRSEKQNTGQKQTVTDIEFENVALTQATNTQEVIIDKSKIDSGLLKKKDAPVNIQASDEKKRISGKSALLKHSVSSILGQDTSSDVHHESASLSEVIQNGKSKLPTGRLTMAINKLLAKQSNDSTSQHSSDTPPTESNSLIDFIDGKRSRKCESPRQIKRLKLSEAPELDDDKKDDTSLCCPKYDSTRQLPMKILENLLIQPIDSKNKCPDIPVEKDTNDAVSEPKGLISVNLPPLYEKLTLKDLLSTDCQNKLDLSLKTTELIGPEQNQNATHLDINTAQNRDDLIKMKKWFCNEKYRLRRLAPESDKVRLITELVKNQRPLKPENKPILKTCLNTENDLKMSISDKVNVEDVIPKKPIKIIIKKSKNFQLSQYRRTSSIEFNEKSKKTKLCAPLTETLGKRSNKKHLKQTKATTSSDISPDLYLVSQTCVPSEIKPSVKQAIKVCNKKPISKHNEKISDQKTNLVNSVPETVSKPAFSQSITTHIIEDSNSREKQTIPNNDSQQISKTSEKIKRKYTKKSSFWTIKRQVSDFRKGHQNPGVVKIKKTGQNKRKYEKQAAGKKSKNSGTYTNLKCSNKSKKVTKQGVAKSRKKPKNKVSPEISSSNCVVNKVKGIKRKYTKKSSFWFARDNTIMAHSPLSYDIVDNGQSSKTSIKNITKGHSSISSKSDIKKVLKKYITKRQDSSSNLNKPKCEKKTSNKKTVNQKSKYKVISGKSKNKISKSKKDKQSLKNKNKPKKKLLKVKFPIKPKNNNIEVYIDVQQDYQISKIEPDSQYVERTNAIPEKLQKVNEVISLTQSSETIPEKLQKWNDEISITQPSESNHLSDNTVLKTELSMPYTPCSETLNTVQQTKPYTPILVIPEYPYPKVLPDYPYPKVLPDYPHPKVMPDYPHPKVLPEYPHPQVMQDYPHPQVMPCNKIIKIEPGDDIKTETEPEVPKHLNIKSEIDIGDLDPIPENNLVCFVKQEF